MKDFAKLLQTEKTIFTVTDIYQIFSHYNKFSLRNAISRLGKQWFLINICKGIRALPKYNIYELANILQKPSYISLETVLNQEWIIFQDYGNILFSISIKTRDIKIWNLKYSYKTIKKEILLDPKWIAYTQWYAIASPERAICDRLYLTPNYHFDNLRGINRQKLQEIATIYNNQRLILDIKNLQNGTGY